MALKCRDIYCDLRKHYSEWENIRFVFIVLKVPVEHIWILYGKEIEKDPQKRSQCNWFISAFSENIKNINYFAQAKKLCYVLL